MEMQARSRCTFNIGKMGSPASSFLCSEEGSEKILNEKSDLRGGRSSHLGSLGNTDGPAF